MKGNKNILDNLIFLRNEWQTDKSITEEDRKFRIGMIDPFIRSHEIVLRLNEYQDNGYYFGYLLIQSQRIEATLKPVILQLERYKAKKESREVRILEDDLDIPLGSLINKLEQYIESNVLFSELKNFKNFRNKIIHKIDKDPSIPLSEIENSILKECHPESINRLQSLVFRIYLFLDPSIFNFKVLQDFMKEYNLEDISIKIL